MLKKNNQTNAFKVELFLVGLCRKDKGKVAFFLQDDNLNSFFVCLFVDSNIL
jgi:hypothetical protein